jgi:hypothetical protein
VQFLLVVNVLMDISHQASHGSLVRLGGPLREEAQRVTPRGDCRFWHARPPSWCPGAIESDRCREWRAEHRHRPRSALMRGRAGKAGAGKAGGSGNLRFFFVTAVKHPVEAMFRAAGYRRRWRGWAPAIMPLLASCRAAASECLA